jgi:DMSO/TMAO reductase YedYZ molybdopterin-dependent catalytic subunit
MAAVTEAGSGVTFQELRLATRNHGMPLEALRYDVTPVGLHYLLTHYDIPHLDIAQWRLRVDGGAGHPIDLTIDELRSMPAVTRLATMECAGNGRALLEPRPLSQPWLVEAVGTSRWTGVRLADVLGRVDLASDAVEVVFTGADRGVERGIEQAYERSLPMSVATGSDALLAYEINGAPLPPQHGSPLRLVVSGWYGMTNVKWLTAIRAVDVPFTGHQQLVSYRLRQDADEMGIALTTMAPRALMVPPGVPDFETRERHVSAGDERLTGRAWSGSGPITEVAVSADGCQTWSPAAVDPPPDTGVWQSWTFTWRAAAGTHELSCRAIDADGNGQPIEPIWNVGGYANNAVQRVRVHVT